MASAEAPVVDVPMPEGLGEDARWVWEWLAPLAIQARTLTPESAFRFSMLCRQVVTERQMAEKILADGLTCVSVTIDGAGEEHQMLRAHPLINPQRAMMQRVEIGLQSFCLAPLGKPMPSTTEAAPSSPLEQLKARRRVA